MADEIPASLKAADANIYKCASRAAQLQAAKPFMAYWCEYFVVNQILARQLHTTDADILAYTMTLMDKLEQTKSTYASEDAVTNDLAGQIYVEQFAQETLDRAQRVIRANKVTANTANTFDAAATFFNLVNIWGPADPETQQKIKYAKYNAARIFRAIKEGKDPNESNPKPEEPAAAETDTLPLASPPPSAFRPATVEDVSDTRSIRDGAGVSLPHSPVSSVPPPISAPHDSDLGPSIPGPPSFDPSAPPRPSSSGGYQDPASAAPTMPSPMSPPQLPASVPDLPQEWAPTPPPPPSSAFSPPPVSPPPEDHYRQAPTAPLQPSAPSGPPTFAPSPATMPAVAPVSPPPPADYLSMTPSHPTALPPPTFPPPQPQQPYRQTAPPPAQAPSPYFPPQPQASAAATAPVTTAFVADDAAMAKAQKHAKWAISALNFEDVPTAIRELRKALETLGAT